MAILVQDIYTAFENLYIDKYMNRIYNLQFHRTVYKLFKYRKFHTGRSKMLIRNINGNSENSVVENNALFIRWFDEARDFSKEISLKKTTSSIYNFQVDDLSFTCFSKHS